MYPFIHLGPVTLPTYGIMLWLAAVTAAVLVDRAFKRAHITADAVGMVAITVVVGIVGGKLWHLADTPIEFRYYGWRALWSSGGFAWYGGLVCGISALMIQGRRAKIGALRMLDLCAPAAAVGYGVGRIGCFLSGDGCYGIAIKPVHIFGWTFRAWGMAFPHGTVPVFVPVYPTPLYELAGGLVIGWWLWRRAGKPHPVGLITGQYLILTGVARFLVEFIRRNPKVLWGMTNAQEASAGGAIVGIALAWWAARQPVSQPVLAEENAAAPLEKTGIRPSQPA